MAGGVRSRRMETFQWDRVSRLADILYGVAVARGSIGYGPLAKRVGMTANHLGYHLGQVSRRSVGEGGPMWTALCVSAGTDRPQDQFYELARELRPDDAHLTNEQLWMAERDRCYAAVG
jgi:hypothetical protein